MNLSRKRPEATESSPVVHSGKINTQCALFGYIFLRTTCSSETKVTIEYRTTYFVEMQYL